MGGQPVLRRQGPRPPARHPRARRPASGPRPHRARRCHPVRDLPLTVGPDPHRGPRRWSRRGLPPGRPRADRRCRWRRVDAAPARRSGAVARAAPSTFAATTAAGDGETADAGRRTGGPARDRRAAARHRDDDGRPDHVGPAGGRRHRRRSSPRPRGRRRHRGAWRPAGRRDGQLRLPPVGGARRGAVDAVAVGLDGHPLRGALGPGSASSRRPPRGEPQRAARGRRRGGSRRLPRASWPAGQRAPPGFADPAAHAPLGRRQLVRPAAGRGAGDRRPPHHPLRRRGRPPGPGPAGAGHAPHRAPDHRHQPAAESGAAARRAGPDRHRRLHRHGPVGPADVRERSAG